MVGLKTDSCVFMPHTVLTLCNLMIKSLCGSFFGIKANCC